jgi:hypothetical protein
MSTERTDQYPEISSDDAGIVPPQGTAKAEWPKKIRTLTASELDRLTIDGLGRFYWDGKLVNYDAHTSRLEQKPVDLDQHAMDLLDRTARELSDPGSVQPEPAAASESATPEVAVSEAATPEATVTAVQPEAPEVATTPADQTSVATTAPAVTPAPVVEMRHQEIMIPSALRPETMRLKLTGWQSLGLIVALLGFVIGAAGLAVSGLVAAHEWGCKAGVVQSYCPLPPPQPKAPPRPEIPA